MTYLYLLPWALIPVLIVIGCIRAEYFPAVALDSPVMETPTQGDGSNSTDKENA